jgi:hypothetical protein
MKTNNLLYILSLVILLGSIFLAVEYQDSGRIQFIAGILTMLGLGMNIVGYAPAPARILSRGNCIKRYYFLYLG